MGRIPLLAHGLGLSIGTDAPLDLAYLDQVAEVVDRLKAPFYSEHLAFTRVPGRNLANLLPLPKTAAVAEAANVTEIGQLTFKGLSRPLAVSNVEALKAA